MTSLIDPHRVSDESRPPRNLGWIVIVVVGITAASHIWKLPAALDRIREDTELSIVAAGVLVALVQVASIFGGLIIAWSGDALGLRRLIILGLVLLSCGSAAGALTQSAGALMAARTLEGIGFLLCTVLGPPLIRRCCRRDRLNQAMAGWATFQGSAALLGFGATAVALQSIDWRSWWLIMAALTLVPVPVLLRTIRPDSRRPPGGRNAFALSGPAVLRTVRTLPPWLAGGVFCSYTFQWMAVMSFLPTLLSSIGVGAMTAGLSAAVIGGINVVGALSAGTALQRGFHPRNLILVALATMALSSVVFNFADRSTAGFPAVVVVGCAIFSLVGGMIPAVITRLTVDVTPPDGSMTASMGLMQQIFNVGNFTGPPLLAWLVTVAGGWHASWWMCVAASTVGAALILLLDRQGLITRRS